jgi:hypothetical protein
MKVVHGAGDLACELSSELVGRFLNFDQEWLVNACGLIG